jgi:thiamine pyrophosphate-dependent acetolactate synthase large subunit-like protein
MPHLLSAAEEATRMNEPTQTDRETAERITFAYVDERISRECVDAIAQALAAAREEGVLSTFEQRAKDLSDMEQRARREGQAQERERHQRLVDAVGAFLASRHWEGTHTSDMGTAELWRAIDDLRAREPREEPRP